jgi:hypothetical protein
MDLQQQLDLGGLLRLHPIRIHSVGTELYPRIMGERVPLRNHIACKRHLENLVIH